MRALIRPASDWRCTAVVRLWLGGNGVGLHLGLGAPGQKPHPHPHCHKHTTWVVGCVWLQETSLGQPFEVDAVLHVDLRAAGRSDQLSDTLSYADAYT